MLFTAFVNIVSAQDKELEEQSLQMLNKDRERAAEEISKINDLLKSVDEKHQSGLYSLSLIEQKMNSRKSALNTIDKQIITLRKQIDEKRAAVEQLQYELQEVKSSYKDLIRRYYSMQSQKNTWMMYIMASESVSQAYRRMKFVREILEILQSQAAKITEMTDRLNNEINEMSNKQVLLSSNISDKQKEMEILKMEERQSKTVASELSRKKSTLEKQLADRQKEYNVMSGQMREFMREELKENRESGISDEMLASAKKFEQMQGFLPLPAIGVIVSHYGENKTKSVYQNIQLHTNPGIDILTAEKAEAYSVFKGTVKQIFPSPRGKAVIVQHGSYYTLYANLTSLSVKVGDDVMARQKLGTVVTADDGSILHFEIWKGSTQQNPEEWILN